MFVRTCEIHDPYTRRDENVSYMALRRGPFGVLRFKRDRLVRVLRLNCSSFSVHVPASQPFSSDTA